MARDTGFPSADAQDNFLRARRRRALARVASMLRREPSDVDAMLPYDEVVAALGREAERDRGLRSIPLDSIVGSVDRGKEFDRAFRPTSSRVRPRFERIADASRRGRSMPPIDVYAVGGAHFVRDGHHRVAVARAHGLDTIDAHVVEVVTRVPIDASLRVGDLPLKGHERLFRERVPLPATAYERLGVGDAERFGDLAEAVEAWGFRLMQADRVLLDRPAVARRWFTEEFVPIADALREGALVGARETEAEAYLRVSGERYRRRR